MDFFEKKYSIEESEAVKDFHKSRRMFYIYDGKLHIAKPNLSYSHAIWFEKLGLISKNNDELMKDIVRGIIDLNGDIYFYIDYDFNINKEAETIFFSHLFKCPAEIRLL